MAHLDAVTSAFYPELEDYYATKVPRWIYQRELSEFSENVVDDDTEMADATDEDIADPSDRAGTLRELIATTEIANGALQSNDRERSFEAVTVLMLQFTSAAGPGSRTFQVVYPTLEEIKDHILNRDFKKAAARLEVLARSLRDELSRVIGGEKK
jgi:hypothetical protein